MMLSINTLRTGTGNDTLTSGITHDEVRRKVA
ncbi:hypothetical protein Mettu_0874 [Methylobacter tundripaludum SV96]|uniref:Uncharacterized protein n=1 Tax=Methylobacter tundripaludum (strain ATCC BAA-1195 / DSM 17260 / SV96) TaxID=697282 RepID=G3IQJ0_METTV|nr:hypothetical protein Mettu_0874 [Methylobacter tundripaludum SV96]